MFLCSTVAFHDLAVFVSLVINRVALPKLHRCTERMWLFICCADLLWCLWPTVRTGLSLSFLAPSLSPFLPHCKLSCVPLTDESSCMTPFIFFSIFSTSTICPHTPPSPSALCVSQQWRVVHSPSLICRSYVIVLWFWANSCPLLWRPNRLASSCLFLTLQTDLGGVLDQTETLLERGCESFHLLN